MGGKKIAIKLGEAEYAIGLTANKNGVLVMETKPTPTGEAIHTAFSAIKVLDALEHKGTPYEIIEV